MPEPPSTKVSLAPSVKCQSEYKIRVFVVKVSSGPAFLLRCAPHERFTFGTLQAATYLIIMGEICLFSAAVPGVIKGLESPELVSHIVSDGVGGMGKATLGDFSLSFPLTHTSARSTRHATLNFLPRTQRRLAHLHNFTQHHFTAELAFGLGGALLFPLCFFGSALFIVSALLLLSREVSI